MDTTTEATTETGTETATVDTAEQMRQVAELVARGANGEARRRMGRVAASADERTCALLGEILRALEAAPAVMVPRLRHLWKQSDDAGRELVEACAPTTERRAEAAEKDARASRADRAERRERGQRAPRDLPTRWTEQRQARSQRATDNDTAARRYFDEREDAAAVTDEQSDYDQLDYDVAAVPPMRGLPCVVCGVERATRDQQRAQDDGLCEDCRDSGTAGVPILPGTATRADVLAARCDHIAATSETPAVRDARLRRDWRHLRTADRFAVTDWRDRQPA